MRSKEEAHDYRYFPDPDLLPLELDPAWIKEIEAALPELPDDKRRRLHEPVRPLAPMTPGCWSSRRRGRDFFEAAAEGRDAKLIANWTTNELLARLAKDGREIAESPIPRRGHRRPGAS